MQARGFSRVAGLATATLTAVCLYAGHGSLAAKPATKVKAAAGSVSQGKALIAQYRCNGCHNTQLQGRPGFSPSIRKTGAMHDYTQPQFAKLLQTGITNDGGHVRPPMPVYNKAPRPGKITTGQANALYAYLETLK